MYVLLDRTKSCVQIGYCDVRLCSFETGVLCQDIHAPYLQEAVVITQDFILWQIRLTMRKPVFFGNRLWVKKNYFRVLFFVASFFLYKKCQIQKTLKNILLIFVLAGIFPLESYQFSASRKKPPLAYIMTMSDWKSTFTKSRLAQLISIQKYNFLSMTIPIVPGVPHLKAIPLNEDASVLIPFYGYLKVPYSRIFVVNQDNKLQVRNALFRCVDKQNSVFVIHMSDDVVFLKYSDRQSDQRAFTIFTDLKTRDSVCHTPPERREGPTEPGGMT